jgi:serine/threonine protein kinase
MANKGTNEKPKDVVPPLRSQFKHQTRPRRQWLIVQEFGKQGGGCNDGIAKVELKDDPIERVYIEKRFLSEHIEMGVAHKEIALLHQLGDWPGVVKMVDHFVDTQRKKASVYLEYCDGRDLESVIIKCAKEHRRIHERKIWDWFISLMDTLVYLHRGPNPENERDVILYWNVVYHCDIKPGNIFLKTDRSKGKVVAKLADFGCSQSEHLAQVTKSRNRVGFASATTPGFEPPEHPKYSGATDVWQLALCIACVCTATINPRSRENRSGQSWSRSQPAGQYYSRELNEILAWCLNDDAKKRPMPMDISRRLKAKFQTVSLPRDDQPLVVLGSRKDHTSQGSHPASSPGERANDKRPGLHPHAFSDPEVDRMEHRGNQYAEFVQNQRFMMHGGRGLPPPRLPGGFVHGYGPDAFPPGFGPGGDFFGGRNCDHDPRYDPRYDPRWR